METFSKMKNLLGVQGAEKEGASIGAITGDGQLVGQVESQVSSVLVVETQATVTEKEVEIERLESGGTEMVAKYGQEEMVVDTQVASELEKEGSEVEGVGSDDSVWRVADGRGGVKKGVTADGVTV